MELKTASELVRFAAKLEEDLARSYELLAQRYPQGGELFLSLAKEGRRNKALIERAYYEVVSDALETGFSFGGLATEEYGLEPELNLAQAQDLTAALELAMEMELKLQRFYTAAAERAKALLADLPRVLAELGKKRAERRQRLAALLEGQGRPE
jgi:rubrerythrin